MNTYKTLAGGTLALALFVGFSAPSAHAANVVDAVVSDPSFQALEDALLAADELADAGLVSTLQGASEITVFAPSNEAFGKLPRALTRAIENDPGILVSILTHHVAPGALFAEDVVAERRIDTLQGDTVMVRTPGDRVYLDRSQVTEVDIELDNDVVVHRIDRVLIPWKSIIRDVVMALRHN